MEKELTGYAFIDKPNLMYYDEKVEDLILENVDQKMLDFIKQSNEGHDDLVYSYFGEKTSFNEFIKKVDDYAKALKKYGLNKGDVVSICLPNIPETMIYFYACNKIGVTPYMIDPRSSEQRIIDCMNVSNSKLLISFLDIMGKKVNSKAIPCDNVVVVSAAGDLKNILKIGNHARSVKALYDLKEKIYRLKTINESKSLMNQDFLLKGSNYGTVLDSEYDPEIPAAIMNTSGTTGTPKGAMESNRGYNITANQITHIAPNLKKRGVTNYGYIPFFSLYGSSTGMHTAISVGANIDIIPKVDLTHFDKIFATKKPNVIIGVPKLFSGFKDSKYIKNSDLSFTELYAIGGDKIAPSKLEEIDKVFSDRGCKYKAIYGYGSTETMMISTMSNNPDTHVLGSCGALYPGVKIKIVERETNKELKYNEEGEIYVNTPTLFMGYIGNPKETKQTTYIDENGDRYYKTGDKGYITKDGILYHTGRYKRLMKRPDGHQVNSGPIEDAIMTLDYVKDCAVVGITNRYQHEGVIPTAFIQLKDKNAGKEVVEEIIRSIRNLVPGDRDMALAYVILDQIPYNINGKVDFVKLEQMKFEDLDFTIIDDSNLDGYFIQNEKFDKVYLNKKDKPKIKIKKI